MLIRSGFRDGPLSFSTKSSPPEVTTAYYHRGRYEVVALRVSQVDEWSYKADKDAESATGRGIDALAQLIADEDWDGGHVRMTLLLAGA
jgi:hypothetical protein